MLTNRRIQKEEQTLPERRGGERENQFVGSMMENKETEEMEIYV